MVRRRRDEGNPRYRISGLCDDFVHLEARKLATFSRLGTLGNLDLDFFSIDKIFGGHSETAGSNLLCLA